MPKTQALQMTELKAHGTRVGSGKRLKRLLLDGTPASTMLEWCRDPKPNEAMAIAAGGGSRVYPTGAGISPTKVVAGEAPLVCPSPQKI